MQKLKNLLKGRDFSFVRELKDRNRGMILLFHSLAENLAGN